LLALIPFFFLKKLDYSSKRSQCGGFNQYRALSERAGLGSSVVALIKASQNLR
jgi:hypothetical protein